MYNLFLCGEDSTAYDFETNLSSNRNIHVSPLTLHNSSSSLDSKGFPLFSPSLSDTEAALAGLMGRLVAGPALRWLGSDLTDLISYGDSPC